MTKYVALLKPGVLYRLFGRNLDSGLPAAYCDEHWSQVVQHLRLRPQQVTAIMECCELYGASLSRLLATRHSLLQHVQFAKAVVYSHPLFPDVHAIVCALHKQQQQQQAQVAPGLE
ncbi:hypothetical protein OEZ85_003000 [Tetradesmus obliquus]|uniref:Uncharacterized protein n=1 Tax=Tetradesmus obliquus TaxID=3088 RepID=A0ABY8U492_TETOB|nr:hypothetical protein OEZ85_003000 [Tetradesmus obliquus]